MQFLVGPIDVIGNLWMIRPRPPSVTTIGPLAGPDDRTKLRIMRHLAVDAAVAQALEQGRSVVFFETGGTFAPRIERITHHLAALDISPRWRWTDTAASTAPLIEDDRNAVAWFLAHSADVLFVSAVSYEKECYAAPSVDPSLRWHTGARARA
jgi:hypothetical protein